MHPHSTEPKRTRQYVRSLFDGIAPRYDLLNRLLSLGVDRRWRRRAIVHLRDTHPKSILDVATGTGDLALEAAELHASRIVGIDIAPRMLERAQVKIAARGLSPRIDLCSAEAEQLPFADGTFDGVMVAFGVRNFIHLERGLRELYRVLRAGGRLVVLEFSHPHRFPVRQLYFCYFTRILPMIGRAVSGHSEAYRYLPDTVLAFPEGKAFLTLLSQTGFEKTGLEALSFGVATVYSGSKPPSIRSSASIR